MSSKLTNSPIDRQNILNNDYAVLEIKKSINVSTIEFEGRHIVLKGQLADYFDVTTRTIDNYIEKNFEELSQNGYVVLKGNSLKKLKKVISKSFGNESAFVTKTTVLGVFDFRAFLNLAMLLDNSESAKLLRQTMLSIVIDTISKRAGGNTKYINQRDEDFIGSWFEESNYRKEFTDALKNYVDMGNFKYPN